MILYRLNCALSLDCVGVTNFAKGLGLSNPSLLNAIEIDCCSSTGIICSNGLVNLIDWSNLNLNGTINALSIPASLISLKISHNQIIGTIPTDLPNSIQFLYLDNNKLTGSIPVTLPTSLTTLDVSGNQLSGNVPSFSSRIANLTLGSTNNSNKLSGSIEMNAPQSLFIQGNQISNVAVKNTSQLGTNCDLSNNPLQGNSNITNLSGCKQDNLYANADTTSYVDSDLTVGAIFGIVIACLVFIAVCIGAWILYAKRNDKIKKHKSVISSPYQTSDSNYIYSKGDLSSRHDFARISDKLYLECST